METKEMKIEVPEGYIIDENCSSYSKIVFRKVKTFKEAFTEAQNKEKINVVDKLKLSENLENKLELSTPYKIEADAINALCKLLYLRNHYNEEWDFDWYYGLFDTKYVIYNKNGQLKCEMMKGYGFPLAFKSLTIMHKFFEENIELIKRAKLLL